ncbi:M15 family metallopeptidase [Streptomyces odontomachi]|uniref:M15 family metallopeptidase n=1 Tax=Streptomyces odontomachi TaxID=2944940 RepID=UPI0027E31114|nr:M15 family metallopeptidase [Streptomyces sp. ODS25]
MILLSDPRVHAVPVVECGEPLAEVTGAPELRLDPRERDPEGAYGRMRSGVLARLRRAARELPDGIVPLVVEGHRSVTEQARRFAAYEDRLRAAGVTDPVERHRRAAAFVSPVEVAPHCAGAAVDLTLADATGAELDMGGAVNGHRAGSEATCPFDAPGLSRTARHHRDLLARALRSAGFVNYPTEWWHWSYGDRYWALTTGADGAVYGPVE